MGCRRTRGGAERMRLVHKITSTQLQKSPLFIPENQTLTSSTKPYQNPLHHSPKTLIHHA